ncbi:formylglycine-generating enzyme family protein [Prevotella hominis]|uniref:formylglycine-generating enzyme family protein n=1 Tax=Segatella hominis TaxID=2518605 RepID=UPI001F2A1ECE|nr:formylglycine-generating enzyme family protein [Segatella hominis]MCF2590162.1 formylglycine-generating enzyme family protein [Segatella hominis]
MRKILLSIVLLFATISSVFAQKLTVESFKLVSSDLTAQTQPRKDLNNSNCALIKVGIALDGVKFDGSIMGEPVQKLGEYWVYMPKGVSMLQVLHKNYTPLMINFYDYGIGKVESGATYVLTLKKPNTIAERQSQKLRIKYSPTSASVLVDNKFVKGTNGIAETTLTVGQHSYIVACDGYESEEGTVKLKASTPSTIQITLLKESIVDNGISENNNQHIEDINETTDNDRVAKLLEKLNDDMVYIEAVEFTMGATKEQKGEANSDEKPAHPVVLNCFNLCKYEVTQELWEAVMGDNPSHFKGKNLPVENVSWDDCQMFIMKLNELTGKNYRLPTEAEWEYAARGGSNSMHYKYSGGNYLEYVSWYFRNSMDKTHMVGMMKPNELGLYDMSGNVWEWCQDWYGSYDKKTAYYPTGPIKAYNKVFRGGGYDNGDTYSRCSYRNGTAPQNKFKNLGLRLAHSI